MEELGCVLRTYQLSEDIAGNLLSALWSDIGKTFYTKHGWEPFPAFHISVPARFSLRISHNLPRVKPLRASDIEPFCAADEREMRRHFSTRPVSSPPAFALLPDFQTISWHHARENFVARELYGIEPEIKGGLVLGPPGQRVWCYWALMWQGSSKRARKGNTLHILRLVMEDAIGEQDLCPRTRDTPTDDAGENDSDGSWTDDSGINNLQQQPNRRKAHVTAIEALLRTAQTHAKTWKMENVQLWNPRPETVEAARRIDAHVKITERETQSIPSIKWFGNEKGVNWEWHGNEKYGWC